MLRMLNNKQGLHVVKATCEGAGIDLDAFLELVQEQVNDESKQLAGDKLSGSLDDLMDRILKEDSE